MKESTKEILKQRLNSEECCREIKLFSPKPIDDFGNDIEIIICDDSTATAKLKTDFPCQFFKGRVIGNETCIILGVRISDRDLIFDIFDIFNNRIYSVVSLDNSTAIANVKTDESYIAYREKFKSSNVYDNLVDLYFEMGRTGKPLNENKISSQSFTMNEEIFDNLTIGLLKNLYEMAKDNAHATIINFANEFLNVDLNKYIFDEKLLKLMKKRSLSYDEFFTILTKDVNSYLKTYDKVISILKDNIVFTEFEHIEDSFENDCY